jgi:hypothetical protein
MTFVKLKIILLCQENLKSTTPKINSKISKCVKEKLLHPYPKIRVPLLSKIQTTRDFKEIQRLALDFGYFPNIFFLVEELEIAKPMF